MNTGFAPSSGRAESSSHAAAGESGKEGKSGDKAGINKFYVHLQPMLFPIINDSGAEQIVTLIIDIQVKDIEMIQKMREEMPKIQDAIFQALYGGLNDGSLRRGKDVDIPKTRSKIYNAVSEVMGKEEVIAIFIKGIAHRKL